MGLRVVRIREILIRELEEDPAWGVEEKAKRAAIQTTLGQDLVCLAGLQGFTVFCSGKHVQAPSSPFYLESMHAFSGIQL